MFLKNIIFVLLFSRYCFGDKDVCPEVKESLGSLLYNRILVGHVIKTLLTRGIFSCAHKCLSLFSCSSYNYETSATQDHGVCELNNASGDYRQNLTERLGFVFAEIQRKEVSILFNLVALL